MSFHIPPEITGFGWANKTDKLWLHTDQSYLRNDFECVQGWINAYDTNEGDATLKVRINITVILQKSLKKQVLMIGFF